MGNNYFDFKRFRVEQNCVSMRVNTDGVLLGAWFSVPQNTSFPSVLDVGTATGVIALVAAQRLSETNAGAFACEAVEIDLLSCIQAQKNFAASPWKKQMTVYHSDYSVFAEEARCRYDVIVSNPPYFNNSLRNPSEARRLARHTDSLTYRSLIESSVKLLNTEGHLSVILPQSEFSDFEQTAVEAGGLVALRKCNVYSKSSDKDPIRIMAEFYRAAEPVAEKKIAEAPYSKDLCIINSAGDYTPDYKELTRNFYLKF